MTIAERMRSILNSTSAYSLTGESSADWELNAEAEGLGSVEDEIDALFDDLFPSSASAEQLTMWESIYQPQPGDDTDERRKVLAARLSVRPVSFTPGDYEGILNAAGVDGTVSEESSGLVINVQGLLGVSADEAKIELKRLLPSHISWTWQESESE